MRIAGLVLGLTLVLAPCAMAQSFTFPPGAEEREAALLQKVGPQARAFIANEVARESGSGGVTEAKARSAAQTYLSSFGGSAQGDIEALAFLVLMQAAHSSQEDTRAAMQEVKDINAAKQAERDHLAAMKEAEAKAKAEAQANAPRYGGNLKALVPIAPVTPPVIPGHEAKLRSDLALMMHRMDVANEVSNLK